MVPEYNGVSELYNEVISLHKSENLIDLSFIERKRRMFEKMTQEEKYADYRNYWDPPVEKTKKPRVAIVGCHPETTALLAEASASSIAMPVIGREEGVYPNGLRCEEFQYDEMLYMDQDEIDSTLARRASVQGRQLLKEKLMKNEDVGATLAGIMAMFPEASMYDEPPTVSMRDHKEPSRKRKDDVPVEIQDAKKRKAVLKREIKAYKKANPGAQSHELNELIKEYKSI